MKLRAAILSAFVTLLVSVAPAAAQEIQDSVTREILREFYVSTNGPQWKDNTNWLSDKPLDQWYGLRVELYNPDSARVTISLELRNNNLSGPIPQSFGNISFRKIDLSDNNLSGPIPRKLLAPYSYLYLRNNNLTDTIHPDSLKKIYMEYDFRGNNVVTPLQYDLHESTYKAWLLLNYMLTLFWWVFLILIIVFARFYYRRLKKGEARWEWWAMVYVPLALLAVAFGMSMTYRSWLMLIVGFGVVQAVAAAFAEMIYDSKRRRSSVSPPSADLK